MCKGSDRDSQATARRGRAILSKGIVKARRGRAILSKGIVKRTTAQEMRDATAPRVQPGEAKEKPSTACAGAWRGDQPHRRGVE